MNPRSRWIVLVACAAVAGGCLSQSHEIPRGELMALAHMPPQQRGEHVRVIQGFSNAENPPPAPYDSHTDVIVVGEVGVGGGGPPSPRPSAPAKANADEAWALVVLAAALGVGLAATEGARFDGWVRLDPMHPVHLYGWDGQYMWRPLSQIDPETAAWTRKAFVRPSEGPWQELQRAPLDRQGWTYTMLLGGAQMPSELGDKSNGFLAHIGIGNFPTPQVGVLVDFGLGWRQNANGDTLYDSRTALELQVLPLAAGKLHAGGFGDIGYGARLEDNVDNTRRRGPIYGGGGLLQLELTTRLAITARLGATHLGGDGVWASDIGVGISVY